MTEAAKQRRKVRKALTPLFLESLNTRSTLRYFARPKQLRRAAEKLAFRAVARGGREAIAKGTPEQAEVVLA